MPNAHSRLQRAREIAGYNSASAAADALGVARPTYLAHENGSRGFKAEAERYAKFFRVSFEWLATGTGQPRGITLDERLSTMSDEDRAEVMRHIEYIENRARLKSTG